jgi:hypothetical protein
MFWTVCFSHYKNMHVSDSASLFVFRRKVRVSTRTCPLKVKVKLSLCFEHHAIKAYWGVEI